MELKETITSRILAQMIRATKEPFLHLIEASGQAKTWTYAELIDQAQNWAYSLENKGIKTKQRVIICLKPSIHLYTAYLGCALLGAVPAMFALPSSKMHKEAYLKQLLHQVEMTDASLLVVDQALEEEFKGLINLPSLSSSNILLRPQELNFLFSNTASSKEIAFLQYSSGTTGHKKGVAIHHQALLWQIDQYAKALKVERKDKIVSWLPLYHDMGLIACYWLPIIKQIPIIAMSPFDWVKRPKMLFEAITQYQSSLCWLPNFAYHHLIKTLPNTCLVDVNLSSMRAFINCSEPVMTKTHEAFYQAFKSCGLQKKSLWTCYAMAETTFAMSSGGGDGEVLSEKIDKRIFAEEGRAVPHENGISYLSSGKLLDGTKCRIRRKDGTSCEEREVGEITVRSPCLMKGYWRLEEETQKSFLDAWYCTGDLGYLVGNELFVTGRKKDLLIIHGKNIYPQDIEYLLYACEGVIPGRAVALGRWSQSLGSEELIILAETHLEKKMCGKLERAIYQKIVEETEIVPKDICLVPHMTLKKSSSGKLARKANLAFYEDLEEAQEKPKEERSYTDDCERKIYQCLKSILAKSLQKQVLTLKAHEPLISSGLIDSLGLVYLILKLEETFFVKIPQEKQVCLEHFDSVNRIKAIMKVCKNAEEDNHPSIKSRQNMSIRDSKCYNFINGPKDYDLLILGSSRVNGFSAKVAKEFHYRSYNFSVNTALAEDWWCILNFVLERNHPHALKHVFLGLDLFAFSNKVSPMARLLKSPFLQPYLDSSDCEFIKEQSGSEKFKEKLNLLNPNEKDRYNSILLNLTHKNFENHLQRDFETDTGDMIFLNEKNPISYQYNQRIPMELKDKAVDNVQEKIFLEGFTALSLKRVEFFLKSIALCLDRGIEVTCFLPPVHPILMAFYYQGTHYKERELELLTFLQENCGNLMNFFDCRLPNSFGASSDDFIDLAHLSGHSSDLLFVYLLKKVEGPKLECLT